MPDEHKSGKRKFFWGVATSAHQTEGGTDNDWSEWEKKNAPLLVAQAKEKWSDWQQDRFPEMFDPANYISGRACDHYNRYIEDFDLLVSGGHNAHRFSVEWSRVEPEEGKFNTKELHHYADIVEALRERNIEPFVTLWHWPLPRWLAEKGGLLAKDFPEVFARYEMKVMEAIHSRIEFAATVNEPNSVIGMGYLLGAFPPQKRNVVLALRAYKQLALGHKKAYQEIKRMYPRVQIGFTEWFLSFCPRNEKSFFDRWSASFLWKAWNERFVSKVSEHFDFLGVQNYNTRFVGLPIGRKKSSFHEEVSDLGWGLQMDGLGKVLERCSRYRVPLYVTEDGLADKNDKKRQRYLVSRIRSMQEAIDSNGVDVRGYFHWSFLDNFEWNKGFWPRFGLVEVDFQTLVRKPRKSFWMYKEIIKEAQEKERKNKKN